MRNRRFRRWIARNRFLLAESGVRRGLRKTGQAMARRARMWPEKTRRSALRLTAITALGALRFARELASRRWSPFVDVLHQQGLRSARYDLRSLRHFELCEISTARSIGACRHDGISLRMYDFHKSCVRIQRLAHSTHEANMANQSANATGARDDRPFAP
jgi:hypothetical protein